MCIAALCTPALFLYQVFWQPCYEHLQQQDAAHDTAHSIANSQVAKMPTRVNDSLNGAVQTPDRRRRRSNSSASGIHVASKALAKTRSPEAVSHRPASATQCSSPRATSSSTLGGARSMKNDRSLLDMCATPPRAGSSRRQSKQPTAIPLCFPYDRDLAVYTQETVSYEMLSSEKKKLKKRCSGRRRYRDRSYDEHSDYREHSSAHDSQSESSAEYKCDSELSTGSENSFPDYPAAGPPRCSRNASFFGHQACTTAPCAQKFPPSPDSTPPSSDCDSPSGSPGTYQRNERPKNGETVPVCDRASVQLPARLRPRPLNLNLAPLGHLNATAPLSASVQMLPRTALSPHPAAANVRTASSAAAQRFLAQPTSWLADVDAPTTEYGAQLDFPSDSSEAPPSPAQNPTDLSASPSVGETPVSAAPAAVGSPLVDYSAELGIYPDTSHCPAFDLSNYRAWSLASVGELSDDSQSPWDQPHHRDSLYNSSDRELEPRANLHEMSCGGIEIPVNSRDEEGKEAFPTIVHQGFATPSQCVSEEAESSASSVNSDYSGDAVADDDNDHHVRLAGGLVCRVETLGTAEGASEEVGRNIVSIFSNRRNARTATSKYAAASSPAPTPRSSVTLRSAQRTPERIESSSGLLGVVRSFLLGTPATPSSIKASASQLASKSPPPAPAQPSARTFAAHNSGVSRSLLMDAHNSDGREEDADITETLAAQLDFSFDPENYYTSSSYYDGPLQ